MNIQVDTTCDPALLGPLINIRNALERHPLPWKVTSILTSPYYGAERSWALRDSNGGIALLFVDEQGARRYEQFMSEEFIE